MPPPESSEASDLSDDHERASTSGEGNSANGANAALDAGERQLALSRERDEKSNLQSRPPDGEVVTLRSVTIADVFVGATVDNMVNCLGDLEWVEESSPIKDGVEAALLGYKYFRSNFWIREAGRNVVFPGISQAWCPMPDGVDRIYGEVYVLGPSLVAIVLTFVFDDSSAGELNTELRTDFESQLTRLGGNTFSVRDARGVKKHRIWEVRRELSDRCCRWALTRFPGALSRLEEGPGRPLCALISLAQGQPFSNHDLYMTTLELVNPHLAYRFSGHDYIYWASPILQGPTNSSTVVFNEKDAMDPGGFGDLESSPETVHGIISSMMTADAIFSVLVSFAPRLREVNARLIRLDLNKASTSDLSGLRMTLLTASAELAAVASDTNILTNDPYTIWADLEDLSPLKASSPTATAREDTATMKRRAISSTLAGLLAEERALRELLLATTEAKSDVTNTALQKSVRTLTIVLTVLTGLLVIFGLVALL